MGQSDRLKVNNARNPSLTDGANYGARIFDKLCLGRRAVSGEPSCSVGDYLLMDSFYEISRGRLSSALIVFKFAV
jgi:hypothetical protein